MPVTAAQVKELRDKTGAGMLDCKNALAETDGDMEKAIDWLREKGIAKSAKKAGRIAAEGLTKVLVDGNKAVLVEINSETDFVAKNTQFLQLLDDTCATIVNSDAKTNELKLKYLSDNKFDSLHGDELKQAIVTEIKGKDKDLKGTMQTQGTTPRRLTDLIGSLCDLTSGSGDKGKNIRFICKTCRIHKETAVGKGI